MNRRFQAALEKLRTLAGRKLARVAEENTFLFLLPLVGLAVGFASVFTAHVIAFFQKLCWGSGQNLLSAAQTRPWPQHILIPLAGGLVVGLIGWLFHVQTRGGGITTIMQAVGLKGGVVTLRDTIPRDFAATVTIAAGGSLGREGAMAMVASAIGSNIGQRFHLTTQQLRILVCASAAAALAAVYNAPIGGSLFALEILMGNFALEVLGPVVVVSVISTLVFRSCMGSLPRFDVPHYNFVSAWELIPYLLLGVLAGLTALIFVRLLFGAQDLFEKIPLPGWAKPALGMLLVGVIGVWWPHVYGNGFEVVNLTLREQIPILVLVALGPLKMIASSLTFGSGNAGGLFTPSLMLGALLGGVFGYGTHTLFPNATAEPGAYALVGMGGVLAGMTHAPLTAIMMIFEQTNSYQIVLPLMFVCIVSHFTVTTLKGGSLEQETLRRSGVVLPTGPEGSVMQTLRVADIMHAEVDAVKPDTPFATVVEWFLKGQRNWLYVVDDQQRFRGAISLHAIKDMLHQTESLGSVVADDLADSTFGFATPEQHLADTMDQFWRQNCERLPVLDSPGGRKLIGWISKRDLIGIYSQEILRKRQLLGHFVMTDNGEKRDAFVELPAGFALHSIEVAPPLEGVTLEELAARSAYDVHVLAIRRRDPVTGRDLVLIPEPKMAFSAGDRLELIGLQENIARFEQALAGRVANTQG